MKYQRHNNMKNGAFSKATSISPRKVSLVASLIRSKSIGEAEMLLQRVEKRAGKTLLKILKSAVANATHNGGLDENALVVGRVEVTGGPALKRYHPSSKGRVHPYKKRTSHIRIVLEEKK